MPRPFTSKWRRISRLADFLVELKEGGSDWGKQSGTNHFSSVFVFPLSKHRPWKLRNTKFVEKLEGELREVHKNAHANRWHFLRKLLQSARNLEAMRESLVRGMLSSF